MTKFTWSNWVGNLVAVRSARKPRRARMAQIEGLEDRALLTANLPVAVADTYSVDQDATLTASTSVLANDTDADGDTISQAILQNNVMHGSLTLNSNGTFTYTPNAGFNGTDTFTYFAKDVTNNETSAAAATVTINVVVNDAPVVNAVTLSTPVNTALTGTLTGTDANGDVLTFAEGATAETNGTVVINSNGSFTFTPTNGFTGTASFSYRANDGSLNSSDATVTVNVTAANAAPVVNNVTLSTPINVALTGTLTGTDANGDTLTFAEGSTAETNGTVVINSNGTFTFTPTNGFTGTASFSYRANDGALNSSDATVTVNVTAANAAPVVSNVTLSTPLNTALTGTLTGTDANGDTLTFAEGATAETHGTVVINSNGTFTFTPTNGYTGPATFSYRANDGTVNSSDATVTINVGSTNTAPVVSNVTLSTPLNTALTGTLTGTDANGDTLTFAEGATAETHGTVVINSNGTFTFTPTTGYTGAATFSFRANDGTVNSNDATVTINVGAGNVAPVVTNVTLSTPLNTALTGTLTGTDADGNTLTFAEGATAETHGTVVINSNGTFTFTPTTGYTGPATFSYRANDGTVNSSDATVTINVGTANVAPVVIAGNGNTSVNTALNGSLATLATDVNGDALSFAVASQPANGSVTVNSNGTFTFTPNTGFTGTTSFTFTASDGTLTSNVGTFTVVVADTTVGDFDLNLAESVTIGNSPANPTPLDSSVSLTNVAAGTSFANAQLNVGFESGVDPKKDRLVVIKKSGNVQVKGKKIFVDGSQVATRTSSKKKGSDLNISFNSSATQADVEAVLRRVAIQTRPSATGGVRLVGFQLSADGTTANDTISASLS